MGILEDQSVIPHCMDWMIMIFYGIGMSSCNHDGESNYKEIIACNVKDEFRLSEEISRVSQI